jgi:cytochrome c oxidase cbb3-type subunit 3
MTMRRLPVYAVALTWIAVAGCGGSEDRKFREQPPSAEPSLAVPVSELQPGGTFVAESTKFSYGSNAFAIRQGQQLFNSMNCVGCHFHGGGGIGPALMDDEWIYGSDPSQIFNTIVEGRPNGMPSFKGKLSPQQVWEIVAYVRTMSGFEGTTVASSRDDHMYLSPDLAIRSPQKPRNNAAPSR